MLKQLSDLRQNWWLFGLVWNPLWGSFLLKPLDPLAPFSFEAYYLAQGVAAALIAIVFFVSKADNSFSAAALNWPLAVIMCLCPFLALYPIPQFYEACYLLSAAIGGATWVWFYAQWFYVYSKLDQRSLAYYALLSFALMPVLRFPLEFIPLDVAIFITAVIPFLNVVMQKKALANVEGMASRTESSEASNPTGLVLVIIELVIYGVVMGLFRVNTDTSQNVFWVSALNLFLKMAFPLLLLVIIRFAQKRVGISLICQLALVFMLVAMVVASNIRDNAFASFMIFDFMRQVMYILLFYTMSALASRTKLHPMVLFGTGWAPYVLALTLGMVLADWMGSLNSYSESFIINVICLLTVSTVLVFIVKDDADVRLFSSVAPEDTPILNSEEIDRRCGLLAEKYSLTKREQETMELICRGRSKRYIAEHLIISENTVRSYAKSLYVKLGVHSRQDLLDLLEISMR